MREMRVTTRPTHSDHALHVRITGELTYDTELRARSDFWNALGQGHARVVVDVSTLRTLDSSGLSTLIAAWQQLSRDGRHFEVRGITGQPARLLAMTGCLGLFASPSGACAAAAPTSGGWPTRGSGGWSTHATAR